MTDLRDRVLILALSAKDAAATCRILTQAGVDSFVCQSLEQLVYETKLGAGALILAKEVLTPESVGQLSDSLNNQPAWSYLPIILLIGAGDLALRSEAKLQAFRPLRNTTFLERPVRVGTLLSVVQSALGDRSRQYEVRDLLQALEKSKHEAIEASQAKSSFLANMSHEIRTPLGAILGSAELLVDPQIPEAEKQSYLRMLKRNGQLLSALIDDILDLAKVESGRIDVEDFNVSLEELISEVINTLQPQATAKGLPIVVSWADNVPRVIRTDSVRLKQVLINVIGNAIKFTTSGKIDIHLKATFVDKVSKQGRLHIEVSDSGLGISVEQAANLFQPFTQADSSITRKYGGTGLGLVLSKKLSQALGGDLVLKRSQPGTGSTFEIIIGLRVLADAAHLTATKSGESPKLEDKKVKPLLNCRILLVDDSKDNRVLIGRMLKLSGAEVKTAEDGLQGVHKAMSEDFDVVLMDIQMPKLGGHEATLHLREKGYIKPVIALTAHALQDDRDKCLAAGCSDYLTKPVDRSQLIQTVLTYIS